MRLWIIELMLEKNCFFSFLGTSFFAPKSTHWHENKPVLGPDNNVFSFWEVTYEEILNVISSLDISKSTQSEDIPFKVIKDNADSFANFIFKNFNKCNIDGKFPDQSKKKQMLVLSLKRETIMIKPIIDRWLSYPCFQKFMSISFITR